jgi:BirA family biotin operon repressor/biotin-[acetyl-CoA-carboxylase] ligase
LIFFTPTPLQGAKVQDQASKERILGALLREKRISGQALADAAGISRTAVWKHICGLRDLGFRIEAGAGKGYSLQEVPDSLHPLAVRPGLVTGTLGRVLEYREEVASTQQLLRELAGGGAPEGSVVLADRQALGRGRRQRGWISLSGSLAMSVLFTPRVAPHRISQFLLLAGVAAAEAISLQSGVRPGLKWPNDVLLEGKKVGGILAEMSSDAERIEHVILGLGLNLNTPADEIPPEIRDQATSVLAATGSRISRPALVRDILIRLERFYHRLLEEGPSPVREQWLAYTVTLGRRVRVETSESVFHGMARDIDESGALLLQDDSGVEHRLVAGDVSLRTREQTSGDR